MPTRRLTDFEIDLETLGRRAGCAVLSVGAVAFGPGEVDVDDAFYAEVDLASCTSLGLHVDPDTELWWDKQREENPAAAALLERTKPGGGAKPLRDVMGELCVWVATKCGSEARPWANGASFDIPIVEAAMEVVGATPPWKFWNHRCHRTVADHWKPWLPRFEFVGQQHHARDDAIHQARIMAEVLRRREQALAARG